MNAASPQLEDGHTRVANELLEALMLAKLTSRQWAVVMALIRKTYGYNKKTDDIGLSQLCDLTGLAKPHVSVTVRELEDRKIISRKQGRFGHIMGINKNHAMWVEVDKKAVKGVTELVTGVTETVTVTESVTGGYRIGKAGVTETVTTKDKPTKDNKQKKAPRLEISFENWIQQCKQEGKQPIPDSDPVFDYVDRVGIPEAFLRLQWNEFKERYTLPGARNYKSWPLVFLKSVKGNWFKIWYANNEGHYSLTTVGQQASRNHKDEAS